MEEKKYKQFSKVVERLHSKADMRLQGECLVKMHIQVFTEDAKKIYHHLCQHSEPIYDLEFAGITSVLAAFIVNFSALCITSITSY